MCTVNYWLVKMLQLIHLQPVMFLKNENKHKHLHFKLYIKNNLNLTFDDKF
jgi:hypothetical protein